MMCLKSRVRSFLNAPLLLHDKMGQNSTGTLLNRRFFQPGFWFRRFLPNGSAYKYITTYENLIGGCYGVGILITAPSFCGFVKIPKELKQYYHNFSLRNTSN